MLQLRPYQEKTKKSAYHFLKQGGKHCIICAPTGSGKTVIFTSIAKDFNTHDKRVLILTDRVELLKQAGGALKKVGLKAFYIQAGCKVVSNNFLTYIAMSQTLKTNRVGKNQYWDDFISSMDVIIIDECHKQEFNYIFEDDLVKDKWVLGSTATPKRSGKMRQLALDYQQIIEKISIQELIKDGYLVNDDYYSCGKINTDGLEIDRLNGDYKRGQLYEKFDKRQLYAGVVKNYNSICPNTKTLIFCVSKQHAIKTAIEFHEAGISCKFIVSGSTKPKEPEEQTEAALVRYNEALEGYELYNKWFPVLSGSRKEIFDDFANNKYKVLINVDIATTGFDCPDIETIILNFKTVSIVRLLQAIGRGSRPAPNKTHFNILDFGDNCAELGYYSENRIWGLWHDEIKGDGLPPVKECGFDSKGRPILNEGGCRVLILASYKICPFCGFKYPDKEYQEIDLELEFFNTAKKIAVKTKRIKDMSLQELKEYQEEKNHKQAWLWRQIWYKGKEKLLKEAGEQFSWKSTTVEKAINFCKNF